VKVTNLCESNCKRSKLIAVGFNELSNMTAVTKSELDFGELRFEWKI